MAQASEDEDVPRYLLPTKSTRRKTGVLDRRAQKRQAAVASEEKAQPGQADSEPPTKSPSDASTGTQARFKANRTKLQLNVDHMDALKAVPLFKHCTPEFLEILAEQVVSKVFEGGTVILKQGDFGDCMYILHIGEVDVLVGDMAVAVLGSGSVFGEMAAICKDPVAAKRNATIRARSFCDCRVIGRSGLMRTLTLFPDDAAVIEVERQRRFEELRAKGAIPTRSWSRPERAWCRPLAGVAKMGSDKAVPEDKQTSALWKHAVGAISLAKAFSGGTSKAKHDNNGGDDDTSPMQRVPSKRGAPAPMQASVSEKVGVTSNEGQKMLAVRKVMSATQAKVSMSSVARSFGDVAMQKAFSERAHTDDAPQQSLSKAGSSWAAICPNIVGDKHLDQNAVEVVEDIRNELLDKIQSGASRQVAPGGSIQAEQIVEVESGCSDKGFLGPLGSATGLPMMPNPKTLPRAQMFMRAMDSEPWALQHTMTASSSSPSPGKSTSMPVSPLLRPPVLDGQSVSATPGSMQGGPPHRSKRTEKAARHAAITAASAAMRVSSGPASSRPFRRKVDTKRLMRPTVNTVSRQACVDSIQGWLQSQSQRVEGGRQASKEGGIDGI